MIISHKLKYFYVHVPKTGGTSIKKILLHEIFQPDETGWWAGSEKKEGLFTHASAKEIKEHLIKNKKNPEDYFKFGFIRNPWDMMVSNYEYYKQIMSKKNNILNEKEHKKIKASQESFEKFLKVNLNSKWIENRLLTNDKLEIDFIGKFENIEKDAKIIFKKILENYKDPVLEEIIINKIKTPHENKTTRKPYQEYYNEINKKLVQDNFQNIIKLGNYKF